MERREIDKFLKEVTDLKDEQVVKELLNYLEMEFRKMCLNLLHEVTEAGIILKSMYSEIASLQRPSWGCWNGFLLGVLKERRRILNTGSPEQREIINKSKELTWASIYMEQAEEIKDEDFKEKWQRIVGQTFDSNKKKSVKVKELLSIPIQIRNRAAHDNVQDKAWWEDVKYILSFITNWYLKSEIEKHNSNINSGEPWLFKSDEEMWCYNGIDTRVGENTVFYVSVSGKSKLDHQRDGSVMLALKKILGEENLQEANFKRLMNKLAPEELKGFFLGGYIVGEKSGEGGFAEVYKGTQLSTGRKVALKILKSGLSDTDKERFLQEAKYLSIFDHPNITKVYEQDEQPWRKSQLYDLSEEEWFNKFKNNHGTIVTYIAMEWIEGKNLDNIYLDMKNGESNFEERKIAQWFMSAAEALEIIHNANLIHRDISPKNIMITEDGTVKLMDFGISKTQFENHTIVTDNGKILGSEPYMSPEQLDYERARAELGPRSDIYSLGSTFYELFTRTRLYNHNNDAVSIATASQLKRKGEKPKSPRLIDKRISWEISTILMGCLENEPSDRFSNAQNLKEDIQRYLADIPIRYKRPSFGRRLRLMYKRNRKIMNLSAAFLLIIVASTFIYIYSIQYANNQINLKNKDLQQAYSEIENKNDEIESKNKELQESNDKIENKNKELQESNDKLKEQMALTDEQRKIAVQNEEEAKMEQKKAEENEKLARDNEEEANRQRNGALKQKELADNQYDIAYDALKNLSYDIPNKYEKELRSSNLYTKILGANLSFLDNEDKILSEKDDSEYGKIKSAISQLMGVELGFLGRNDDAIKAYDRAIYLNPNNYNAYGNKANTLARMGRYEEAIKVQDLAIAVDPTKSKAYLGKAGALAKLGKYDKSIDVFNKAIEADDMDDAAYVARGSSFFCLKKYEEALTDFNKAIGLNSTNADYYLSKAGTLLVLGKNQEGLEFVNKAIDIEPDYPYAYDIKANILKSLGIYEDAVKAYEKEILLSPKETAPYFSEAKILFDIGKYKDAATIYGHIIELDPNNSTAYAERADIENVLGNYGAAIKDYEEAIKYDQNNEQYYLNLAEIFLMTNKGDKAVEVSKKALNLKAEDLKALLYLAHGYLLNNKFDEAKEIYIKYKDEKFPNGETFKESVSQDFQLFRQIGISNSNMDKIEKLLDGRTSTEEEKRDYSLNE